MLTLISSLFILSGSGFIFIASLGVLKLEDLYQKLHAATKSGTLGCGLILCGIAIRIGNASSITEIILIIIFLAMTSPITAHLLGRIYYFKNKKL